MRTATTRTAAHASHLSRGRTRAALAAAALLAGCGGGGAGTYGTTDPPPAQAAGTVNATAALAFTPATLTVKAGDEVTFAFGGVAHNVYFDAKPTPGAPADIEGQNASVSVKRVFPVAGSYRYVCHIHPFMSGTVVVQAANAPTTTGDY